MKVFISWSGERSRAMARALREWLPLVLPVTPWTSDADIAAGDRWRRRVDEELNDVNVGIACVTPENQHAPWLLFEAGALSKAVRDGAALCALLVPGMPTSELTEPLSAFQALVGNEAGVRRLVTDLNVRVQAPRTEAQLDTLFRSLWPALNEKLENLPEVETTPRRKLDDKIDELLTLVRALNRPPRPPRMPADVLNKDAEAQAAVGRLSTKALLDIVRGSVTPGDQALVDPSVLSAVTGYLLAKGKMPP